jgi:hypothetical protein
MTARRNESRNSRSGVNRRKAFKGEIYLMFKRLMDLLCLSQVSSQLDLNALKALVEM